MEPLSALALAANVIQFVDFSSKLIKLANEVRHSTSGVAEELEDATAIGDNLQRMLSGLRTPAVPPFAPEVDERLAALAKNCSKTCVELETLVRQIGSKDSTSRAASFRTACRTMRKQGRFHSLEKRLDSYRNQILGELFVMMSEKHSRTNDLIESFATSNEKAMQDTREELHDAKQEILAALRSEYERCPSDQQPLGQQARPELLEEIRTSLSRMQRNLKTTSVGDQILKSLWFPELRSREASIREAHDGTYHWLLYDEERDPQQNPDVANSNSSTALSVFEEKSFCNDDGNHWAEGEEVERKARRQKRIDFLKWLEFGHGVFFISGKAGSGKSTLVKRVAQDVLTHKLLSSWANGKEKDLLVIQFFFWNSGSKLQKSVEGLYRGILWEILRKCPYLVEDIFSTEWRKDLESAYRIAGRHGIEPQLPVLEDAFDKLVANENFRHKHRVCIFLDGLDEYEGDYWKLSKRLQTWCCSGDIKICASGRPYNEFQRLFAGTWLMLHELTQSDILRVVRYELSQDDRFTEAWQTNHEYERLATSIMRRANGVFLWVRLAVQALLVGIGNSCSTTQLQQRLETVPSDLNALFQQMLDRIDTAERSRASRSLLLIRQYTSESLPRNLAYIHAVLDDIAEDDDVEKGLLDGTLGPFMNNDDCVSKCAVACRRLTWRCQGLVEVVETGREFPFCHEARFIHRTLSDFLRQPNTAALMQELSGDFSPIRYIALGILATIKLVPPNKPIICPPRETNRKARNIREVDYIARTRSPYGLAWFLVRLAVDAERQGDPPFLAEMDSLRGMLRKLVASGNNRHIALGRPVFCFMDSGSEVYLSKELVSQTDIEATLLCCAAGLGASKLVQEKARRIPNLAQGYRDILLAATISELRKAMPWESSSCRVLLEQKSSPNREGPAHCAIIRFGHPDRLHVPKPPWTSWTLLLFYLCELNFHREIYSSEDADGITLSKYLEAYLAHGADPCVCFVGYKFNEGERDAIVDNSRLYYTDLVTMMRLWGSEVTEKMLKLLGRTSRGWSGKLCEWLGAGPFTIGKSIAGFQYIDTEGLQRRDFLVLKVASLNSLKDIPVSDLEDSLEQSDDDNTRYAPPDIEIFP